MLQQAEAAAASQRENRQKGSDSEWDWNIRLTYAENEEKIEFVRCTSGKMSGKATAVGGGSSDFQPPLSYGLGHLAGTTRRESEAQRQVQRGGKTAQEKTEEEVVTEYVKKQSLLEAHHQSKGKSRATATEDHDDEDFQKALKLSMQEQDHHGEYRNGALRGCDRFDSSFRRMSPRYGS